MIAGAGAYMRPKPTVTETAAEVGAAAAATDANFKAALHTRMSFRPNILRL